MGNPSRMGGSGGGDSGRRQTLAKQRSLRGERVADWGNLPRWGRFPLGGVKWPTMGEDAAIAEPSSYGAGIAGTAAWLSRSLALTHISRFSTELNLVVGFVGKDKAGSLSSWRIQQPNVALSDPLTDLGYRAGRAAPRAV